MVYLDACEAVTYFARGLEVDRKLGKGSPPDSGRSLAEAVRRARATVRRYCAANRLDRLATLTYRGAGCHDEVQVREDVGRFFKELRRVLGGERLPYLWAAEWHPGGHGLHAHFAVGRYVDKRLIEDAWGHGFVHIKLLDAEFSRASALARARIAAAYLAKYVAKAFQESTGLHRYEVGEGFQPRVWRSFADTRDDAIDLCDLIMNGATPQVSTSAEWKDWHGPPTVWMQWTP